MKVKKITAGLAGILSAGILMTGGTEAISAADNGTASANSSEEAIAEQAALLAEDMTLEEKIGQMIMPAFRKWKSPEAGIEADAEAVTALNESIRQEISDCGFGGIILFSENFEQVDQTVTLVQDMQEASISGGHIPMLIAVDQEGGRVVRINTGTTMTGNMALGAIGSADLERGKTAALQTGQVIGEELSALGINVDFAPVMDVNDNPQNPVIGVRSFSDHPDLTAVLGVSMMEGLQSRNVATALKHFPGHGNTSEDSHVGLPSVDKTLEELKQCELVPFQAAIEAGTDMVMTAHIEYPKVETTVYTSPLTGNQIYLPATLSRTMITGVLRTDLNFDGVVVTDAMNMDAIAQNFTPEESAKLAFNADVDMILMPVDTSTEEGLQELKNLIQSIAQMVKRGEIGENTITRSVERILTLKIRRGILDGSQYETSRRNDHIQNAFEIVGSEAHKEVERTLADEAVTLLKNDASLIPLSMEDGQKLLILSPYEDAANGLIYGFRRLQREGIAAEGVNLISMIYHTSEETTAAGSSQANQDMAEKHTAASNSTGQAGLTAADDRETQMFQAMAEADCIVVNSNLGTWDQMNPANENGWRTGEVDRILEQAEALGKKVILVSSGLPYDVNRYSGMDALLVCYCPKGINELDLQGNPVGAAGAMLPAVMDVIFGRAAASGALPVSIP